MSDVLSVIGDGLKNSFLMAYQVWWALVIGFAVSAIVQAWVPREAIERRLSGEGVRPAIWATGLGAASSSCSYAAIAIAKSLFQKGASIRSALAFQFASTNLVWELGLVLWVLLGWRFTLAEFVGGLILVAIMWAATRLFIPKQKEEEARRHAQTADTGHQHHMAGSEKVSWRTRLTSPSAWSDVAHNFRGDWQMLYREIITGFLLAGFIGVIHPSVFNTLFLHSSPGWIRIPENALLGPIIAVLSFVCSVGNIPLAAVLWSGGISFAGVMAFIFADLIVLPIIAIYRKYYGPAFALRITALMFTTMVVAALIVDAVFSSAGLIPETRPTAADIFTSIQFDYELILNALAALIFAALLALTIRRGAKDPVCGMTVDRAKALRLDDDHGAHYFCSEGCSEQYASRAPSESAHDA
ncbi:MAG: permease [Actinomycetota bacterium]|nr:permease [Actinomycetota bacterium]